MRGGRMRWPAVAIRSSALGASVVLMLATCTDATGPKQKTPVFLAQAIKCAASHANKTVKCVSGASGIASSRGQAIANAKRTSAGQAVPGMSAAILGGQGVYVELTASNVISDPDNFNFDAAVRNL